MIVTRDCTLQPKYGLLPPDYKAYDELYEGLDTKEGETISYRLVRQRHQDGKNVR